MNEASYLLMECESQAGGCAGWRANNVQDWQTEHTTIILGQEEDTTTLGRYINGNGFENLE